MKSRARYSTSEEKYLIETLDKCKGQFYKAAVEASKKLDRNVMQLYAKLRQMQKKGKLPLSLSENKPKKYEKTFTITITIKEQ